MKTFPFLAVLLLLTACNSITNPLSVGRIFPDGASTEVIDAQLIVTGTGGTLSAKSIRIIGTNGYPLYPSAATNGTLTTPFTIQPGTTLKIQ